MGTVLSVLLYRVDKRLHSNSVCAFIFLQIVDVEAYSVPFADVPDWEKIPLWVVERVVVEVQEHIVLIFFDSFNFSKVARFKLGVKENGFFIDIVDVERLWWVDEFLRLKMRGHSSALNSFLNELSDMEL